MELASLTAVATEGTGDCAGLAVENPNHVIGAVGHQQVFLLRVMREGKVIDRPARRSFHAPDASTVFPASLGRGMHEEAGYEFSLPSKYLDSIASAFADIDQPIL